MNKALDEVIKYITLSIEYKKCIELKKKMSENKEIVDLVELIKKKQKEYVRNNNDPSINKELNLLEEKLNEIPIYVVYMQNLEKVNEKINLVKDELSSYFYGVLNR